MGDSIVSMALDHLPSTMRQDAARVIYLSAIGFATREIASQMGITWRAVNDLHSHMQRGVVAAMRAEGYSDLEMIRTLRVATAAVVGA